MANARVIDTNVLIVASAADSTSPFHPHATPVQEAQLRKKILDWLIAFESDAERHVVLDNNWYICKEYQNKLSEQDYGWLAIMHKIDNNHVVWVGLELDDDGNAILPITLTPAITDLADRKMVAAVLAGKYQVQECCLTNACDTDWLDCSDTLKAHQITVENIIHDWLYTKWTEKQSRKVAPNG